MNACRSLSPACSLRRGATVCGASRPPTPLFHRARGTKKPRVLCRPTHPHFHPAWCRCAAWPFYQQVPLHTEDPVLGPQPAQLLPLGGGEPVAAPAGVQVRLAQPVADDRAGAAQRLSEFIGGAPAFADQADALGAEFGRVRRMALRHVDSLRGILPKRSGVHQSGATSGPAGGLPVASDLGIG